jgi:hypothetical protein
MDNKLLRIPLSVLIECLRSLPQLGKVETMPPGH